MKKLHFLNGKGHKKYKSKKAQIKFAESLITIGIAFYISAFSPLINFVVGNSIKSSIGLLWITACGTLIGYSFREKGLKIIDEIESELI